MEQKWKKITPHCQNSNIIYRPNNFQIITAFCFVFQILLGQIIN